MATSGTNSSTLPDQLRPAKTRPEERLDFPTVLKIEDTSWRQRIRSTADVLKALGHSSAAFPLYLIIYSTGETRIADLLKLDITTVETVVRTHFLKPTAICKMKDNTSQDIERRKAVFQSLELCSLKQTTLRGHKADYVFTRGPIVYAQELYFLLFSKIWDCLQASLPSFAENPFESVGGCSVADLADLITRDVSKDILANSPPSKHVYWNEDWYHDRLAFYTKCIASSDIMISSLLHRVDDVAKTDSDIPEGIIFDFLMKKFGVDVRAIAQGILPSNSKFASGKLGVTLRGIIQGLSLSRPGKKPLSPATKVLDKHGRDHVDHSSLQEEDAISSRSKRYKDDSSGQDGPSIASLNAPYMAHATSIGSAASEIPHFSRPISHNSSQHDFAASSYDLSRLLPPSDKSLRSSSFSTTSSWTYFKSLQNAGKRQSSTSQDPSSPSKAIRRSQRSSWSLRWDRDSMSALSSRFSKASISTKNSRLSQ